MSSPEPLCGALAGFILVRFLVFWIIVNRFPEHRTAWTPRPEYSQNLTDVIFIQVQQGFERYFFDAKSYMRNKRKEECIVRYTHQREIFLLQNLTNVIS